jgi:hypothetical protein
MCGPSEYVGVHEITRDTHGEDVADTLLEDELKQLMPMRKSLRVRMSFSLDRLPAPFVTHICRNRCK